MINMTTGPMGEQNHVILYKNHGTNIGSWEMYSDGATVFSRSFKKLGGNPVTSQYTAVAKNVGRSNETVPEMQAVMEILSKAKKQIDKGYVTNLEDAKAPATNGLGLPKPMLATPFDKVKPEKIDWSTAYVQPKLDGHRALFKDGVLYSRQGKVLDIPHIVEAISATGLDHLHLDGELYLHGKSLQDLSRLIKKQTEASLALEYHIYDVVMDESFTHRGQILDKLSPQISHHTHLRFVATNTVLSMDHLMECHTHYRDSGYEGTMLRFSDDPYGTDKRSRTLLKVKEFHDAEFEVVGIEEGKPYIKDDKTYRVPVWVCRTDAGWLFNVTAAGTMQKKHAQWEHCDRYVGKQLTVKYHYLSKDGIPQLPVALRWYKTV